MTNSLYSSKDIIDTMTQIEVFGIGKLDVSILPDGYVFLEGESYKKYGVASGFKNIDELKNYLLSSIIIKGD